MARIRNIKPEFFDDEGLGSVSLGARLCFIGLWTQADKAGRIEDRPERLKVRLFPFDRKLNIVVLIDELVAEGCVLRYCANDRAYLLIRKFGEHQYLSKREPDSTLPGPDQSETSPIPALDIPPETAKQARKEKVLDQSQTGLSDIGHRTRDIGRRTVDSGALAPAPRPVPIENRQAHKGHAHCDTVCVPGFLHAEFRQGLNRPDDADGADDELVKGYIEHCKSWPEGKPTGDPCAFWRAWYRAKYPAPTAKATKAARAQSDIEAWLKRDNAQETA